MPNSQPSVFFDTSALFAGIWSAQGGARAILQLAEAGLVQLIVSSQVLAEIEGVLREKRADQLPGLLQLLDICNVQIISNDKPDRLKTARRWVAYAPDAVVIADALAVTGLSFFVTLDREHFLTNENLRSAMPFKIGTPGDFLAWLRANHFLASKPD